MNNQPSAVRTKANSVTMIVLSVVAIIGILLMVNSVNFITNAAAGPSNAAAGLAAIFVELSTVVVVLITTVSLFFALILTLNLKVPKDSTLLSDETLKSYANKATISGMGGILVGSALVLLFVFPNSIKVAAIYSGLVEFGSIALIPVIILIFIWSFIYLFRSHNAQSIILKRSIESSKLIH